MSLMDQVPASSEFEAIGGWRIEPLTPAQFDAYSVCREVRADSEDKFKTRKLLHWRAKAAFSALLVRTAIAEDMHENHWPPAFHGLCRG